MTNAPVLGKVVIALESGFGDPKIAMSTTADAQGHFQFDNVTPADNGWMIAVAARSSDNSLFSISYLVSAGTPLNVSQQGDRIVAGTNVGTITVMPSATEDLRGTVTSENSSGGAQNVNITIDPLRSFTFDRDVTVPWLDSPQQFSTLANEDNCDIQGVSCGTYDVLAPSGPVRWAVYDHNGNNFQAFTGPNDYSVIVNAFSQTTGAPDCNPSSQDASSAGSGNGPDHVHFSNCAP